jgi:hypothetical protein
MSEFFDFSGKLSLSTVQAYAVGLKKDVNGVSDHWNLIKGKYDNIDFPVVFKQHSGKNFSDMLDTGWPNFHLISDRMKCLLEENHLTGWKTFPIKLYDKKNNEISGYYGFSITGQCAPVDYGKSEIIEKRRVPTGPICKFYKGIFIDKWDETDFFSPKNTYALFVTHRVAEILTKNKITNICLVPLSEYEMSVSNVHQG